MTIPEALQNAWQHHQAGRLPEAETLYRQILAVAPQQADTLHRMGLLASQAGQHGAAADFYLRAMAAAPPDAALHANLGEAYRQLGRLDEAIASFHRALQLDPHLPQAHNNLGIALLVQGRLEEAASACRRAIQAKPDYVEAHYNLGVALSNQGRFDDAIVALRGALQLQPAYADAWCQLGNTLQAQRRFDESITVYGRALELRPDFAEARNNLGTSLKETGQLPEAVAAFRQAAELQPANAAIHSNLVFAQQFLPDENALLLRLELAHWEQRHGEPLAAPARPHANRPDPERRLRVGYVSPGFYYGAIACFLHPLLAGHDRARFEIFGYSSVRRPDAMTAKMSQSVDTWREVLGTSDAALAERVREDQIDILVDLTLHSAGTRLPVFARRPAPLQVAWLGTPGSTGLRAMDYRLTDAHLDPEGAPWSASTEEPIRLPDAWFCYEPVDESPEPGELPALRAGRVTFGCVNHFGKVSPVALRRWAGVLRAVEGSRLLLRCPEGESRGRVLGILAQQSIAADRVEFIALGLSRAEYWQLFQRMDIALDPSPYNGGVTTCEALWMGVPVLTLPEANAVSRQGLSIVSAAGFPELAAPDEEAYVKLAVELAGDLPRLAHLRATLRERMKSSALMDAPRFAEKVEQAYRQMWRAWCEKQGSPA